MAQKWELLHAPGWGHRNGWAWRYPLDLERCLFDGIPTAIRIRTAWKKARGKIRGFLGSLHVSLDESELRLCRSALQRSRAKPASRPAKPPARMFKRTLDEASQPTTSQPEFISQLKPTSQPHQPTIMLARASAQSQCACEQASRRRL